MLNQHVRRVPIIKNGALVGVVTLDDLILDGAVPRQSLERRYARGELDRETYLRMLSELESRKVERSSDVR